MMNEKHRLGRKLASRRGATITFALLLFLVCAVIGVIVLVAATAASGRMSRLAESDRRYYAVNSAAQLLREAIEDSTVQVIRTRTSTGITRTETLYEKAGETTRVVVYNWDLTDAATNTYTKEVQNSIKGMTTAELSFLGKAAEYYVFGAPVDGTALNHAQWSLEPDVTFGTEIPLVDDTPVKLKEGGSEVTGTLPPMMNVKMNTSGALIVTIWSEDAGKKEMYKVTMTFISSNADPTREHVVPTYKNENDDYDTTASGVTVKKPAVTTTMPADMGSKTDTFRWVFQSLQKG